MHTFISTLNIGDRVLLHGMFPQTVVVVGFREDGPVYVTEDDTSGHVDYQELKDLTRMDKV